MTTETTRQTEPEAKQQVGNAALVERNAAASEAAWRRNVAPLALAALIVIMVAQLWTSVVQLSITSDEIDHLHAAYRYWECNDFGWNPEHPPLVKIVAGLPLQEMHVNDPLAHACGAGNTKMVDFLAGHQFIFANPEKMLTSARFAVSLFPVLLLVTVWFAARRMFGVSVAIISTALIAFEPNVLANGALITTDVAATLGFLLTSYALYCYAKQPNLSRLFALGLAMGFAFCAKYSMVTLAIIVPAVLLADAVLFKHGERRRTLLHYIGALVAIGFISVALVWACYGFRYLARPGGAPVWAPPRLVMSHGLVTTEVIPAFKARHVLPEAYLVGLQDVLVESEVGRPSFLLGKLYRNSNWFYFPVEASIKFTLPVLFGAVISAFCFRFWRDRKQELFFLITPALLFLAFCMRSGLNIGIRHLLPILPTLVIFGAAGLWSIAQGRRWGTAGVGCVLLFQAASSLHAFPNYLCYSNELWGGPSQTYRYLSHSDVDWGQAQKMVRDYVEKTHPSNCFYIRSYNTLNSDYGIHCGGISEIQWDQLPTPFTGTLIAGVSAVNGVGFRGVSEETRRALKDLKPTAKLGGSAVLVYEGTFDVSPIAALQFVFKARAEGDRGDTQQSLQDARKASALDPANGDAHILQCAGYRELGDMNNAQQQCSKGLELIRKDPQYASEQLRYLENFILKNGLKLEETH